VYDFDSEPEVVRDPVRDADSEGVALAVTDSEPDLVGVPLAVSDGEPLGVDDSVAVSETLAVAVPVEVRDAVWVRVPVSVRLGVLVAVGVPDSVRDCVCERVRDGVAEPVCEAVREKLLEATRVRMVADVPLGAFLSGGIDSSSIVALMAECGSRPVRTFSVGFEEAEFDELPYAREVARRYGTEHEEVVLRPDAASILPLVARHHGEPFADCGSLTAFIISREARAHLKVVLNGDGGDENFAGYMRHRAMRNIMALARLPGWAKRAGLGFACLAERAGGPAAVVSRLSQYARWLEEPSEARNHLAMFHAFGPGVKAALYSPGLKADLEEDWGHAEAYMDRAFARFSEADDINRMLGVDLTTYLPECMLAKMDTASMAFGLEARSPLLDHELVELAFSMPGTWKMRGWSGTKWLLREAMRDKLPPAIQGRGKRGFGIPVSLWMRSGLRGYWRERVLAPSSFCLRLFAEGELRRLFEAHCSGREDHGYRLWILLMLELWHLECGGGSA